MFAAVKAAEPREFVVALQDMADATRDWTDDEVHAASLRVASELRQHRERLSALRAEAAAVKGFKAAAIVRKAARAANDFARDVTPVAEVIAKRVLPACWTAATRAQWMLLHADVVEHLQTLEVAGVADPHTLLEACNACAVRTRAAEQAAVALAAYRLRHGQGERALAVLGSAETECGTSTGQTGDQQTELGPVREAIKARP